MVKKLIKKKKVKKGINYNTLLKLVIGITHASNFIYLYIFSGGKKKSPHQTKQKKIFYQTLSIYLYQYLIYEDIAI